MRWPPPRLSVQTFVQSWIVSGQWQLCVEIAGIDGSIGAYRLKVLLNTRLETKAHGGARQQHLVRRSTARSLHVVVGRLRLPRRVRGKPAKAPPELQALNSPLR